jgi:hypothetical protein
MDDAMAHWKMMPGSVEWCGAAYEKIRLSVCLQMVSNGVHLQHKSGELDGNTGSLPLK